MKFILFIVLLLGGILLLGLSLFRSFLHFFFGSSRANVRRSTDEHNYSSEQTNTSPNREKIFSKDEGEYVDFEEIKN